MNTCTVPLINKFVSSFFLETASFVNVLFDALTDFSYMPQTLVEQPVAPITIPASQLVISPQPVPPPIPVIKVPVQEKPRKTSVTEDVLTTRVLEEVGIE